MEDFKFIETLKVLTSVHALRLAAYKKLKVHTVCQCWQWSVKIWFCI